MNRTRIAFTAVKAMPVTATAIKSPPSTSEGVCQPPTTSMTVTAQSQPIPTARSLGKQATRQATSSTALISWPLGNEPSNGTT